jgi:AraC-like DNA-binding protein
MVFKLISPAAALCDHVQHIIVAEVFTCDSGTKTFKPFPPAPEQAIYFYPRDKVFQKNIHTPEGYQPFSIIVGPQVSRVDLLPGKNHLMIGVVFKPGGLCRMLGLPMSEVFDHYVDSSLVWPAGIRKLEEQMNDTNDYALMIRYVEEFLITVLKKQKILAHPIDEVFKCMTTAPNRYSIDQLASQACLSTRQFDRKFYERIGMGPKLFGRVIRFNNAVRMRELLPAKDWLSIALHSGYYDFQHMLRDFRQFTGSSPTRLTEEDLQFYAYKK